MRVRAFALALASVCIAAPGLAVTRSWTGATSASWADGTNWSPAGIPQPADQLVFPVGATRTVMTNDLPAGTTVGAMDFRTGYTLSGNGLTLTGDLTFDQSTGPRFVCNVPLTLGASVRFGAAITSRFAGAIDVNGHTLTIASYNTTLAGPINGSGTMVVNGVGSTIASSGTFSGTITGIVDLVGSMPAATFSGGLSGSGTTGPVTITEAMYLGSKDPCCWDSHAIGTLHTRSISMGGPLFVDLAPGTSDRLQVTGTVSLGGQRLVLSVPTGAPGAGQSVTIIDNDGTDAIDGTFAGLAEGAQIPLAGAVVAISYHGGDGNDVVLTSVSATKSWTGANSGLWSDPGNWSPAEIPAPGEQLIFPGVARTVMTNDLPAGRTVGAMDFRTGYTLNGNALTLTGDLTFDQSTNPHFVCNVPLTLGAPVRFGAAITSSYNGAIDVNGHTLTIDSYNTTIHGAINGGGAVVVNGYGVSIAGSGPFSGTISGIVDLAGSMPNATFSGALSGNGTMGPVTITSTMYLGPKMPCCADTHGVGTLHTKSITMGGTLFADLVPGGTSDRLEVTGTVTLGGHALLISVPGGSPAAGTSFTIIDNDGTEAISGTFAGLAEGAQFSLAGAVVTISYRGGDGNDVVLSPLQSTKSWTGANSDLWSDPGNWSPAAIPVPGEPLIFPAGVTRTVMTNDLPAGSSVGPLDFRADYTLNGNALTLTGDWSFDQSTNPRFVCNVPLTLGAPVRLGAAITSRYTGAIDVNGHTLTIDSYNTDITGAINGNGTIAVNGAGVSIASSGTFSGTISGIVDLVGAMPAATFSGGLSGSGTIGSVTIPEGSALYLGSKNPCCWDTHGVGALETQSIAIDGGFYADVIAGGTSDQLQVTGTVTLGNTRLFVSVPTGSPAAGQTFMIVDNDGTEPVDGIFEGLAEEAVVSLPPWKFRISYLAGDGNDVVLTAIEDTVTAPSQDAPLTQFGETTTFSVRVTARVGVPDGNVTFTDNGAPLQTVPLVNGAATFAYATLDPGVHTVAAVYAGTPVFAPSNASVTHEVKRGNTTTLLSLPAEPVVHGDEVPLSIRVQPVAPAFGTPSGTVSVATGESSAGAVLRGGAASLSSLLLDAGSHEITASYGGDARFDASSVSANVTVLKASTITEGTTSSDASGVKLTLHVTAEDRPALPVTGMVMITNDANRILAHEPIAGGPVVIALGALPIGEHRLEISYLGTNNFEPSSTTVVHTVRGKKRRAVR